MKDKIKVVIAERTYYLTSGDEEEYVRKVADFVNEQIDQVSVASHASTLDAAIMTAMNIADSYYKAQLAAENLRKQVKQYLDEANQVKLELSESKRELFRLQQQDNQ